jgi:pyruvate formate lyase activating enzyme
MIKEAECYEQGEDNNVKCFLCPRRCLIKPENTGFCRVRENRNGRLFTLIYGETSTKNVEPIEKSLFHFYPGTQNLSLSTVGCTFTCSWCQNYNISQSRIGNVVTFETKPEEVISMAKKYGAQSVTYTYNEPIIWYEFIKDTAKLNKSENIKNILITNGYVTIETLKGIVDYVDAANIDIKSFSEEFYRTYCTGELAPILDVIKYLVQKNIHVELSYLIIPLLNDSQEEIGEFIDWIIGKLKSDIPVHFVRFFPAYKMTDRPPTPADTLMAATNLAYDKGLEYVYIKNVFIEGLEDTHCPRCHTVLITRYGSTITTVNLTEKNECPSCGLKIPIIGKPKTTLSRLTD